MVPEEAPPTNCLAMVLVSPWTPTQCAKWLPWPIVQLWFWSGPGPRPCALNGSSDYLTMSAFSYRAALGPALCAKLSCPKLQRMAKQPYNSIIGYTASNQHIKATIDSKCLRPVECDIRLRTGAQKTHTTQANNYKQVGHSVSNFTQTNYTRMGYAPSCGKHTNKTIKSLNTQSCMKAIIGITSW